MVDDSAMRAKASVPDVSTPGKRKKLKLDKVIANCLTWSADFPDKESNQEDGTITDIKKAEGAPKEDQLPVVLGIEAIGINGWRNGARMDSMERDQQKVVESEERKWGSPRTLGVTDNQQTVAGNQGRRQGRPRKSDVTVNQQKVAGSRGRKRGRPRKLGVTDPMTEAGMKISGTVDGSEMVVNVVIDHEVGGQLPTKNEYTVPLHELVDKNGADVPGIKSSGNEAADMAIIPSEGTVAAKADQPLSMWSGGLSCSLTSNGLQDRKQRQQVGTPATNSPLLHVVGLHSDDSLPFVKRSPVWATLESEEIFRNMPQKPHFRLLMECKEDYREGVAIGIMATFSNLVKKISSLGIGDPRTSFDTTLDSLDEVEKHGFDVTQPRGRINKLLSIREPVSECLYVVKNAERELQQHVEEKRKLDAAIQGIQREISALQQALAATKAEVDANEARAAVVQSRLDEMKGCVENAVIEFQRVAAGPWN